MKHHLFFALNKMTIKDNKLCVEADLWAVKRTALRLDYVDMAQNILLTFPNWLLPKKPLNTILVQEIEDHINIVFKKMPFIVVPPSPMEPSSTPFTLGKKKLKDETILGNKAFNFLLYLVDSMVLSDAYLCIKLTLGVGHKKGNNCIFSSISDSFEIVIPLDTISPNQPWSFMRIEQLFNYFKRIIFNLGFDAVPPAPINLNGIPPYKREKIKEEVEEDRKSFYAPRSTHEDYPWIGRFQR